jgi:hypothetical protein
MSKKKELDKSISIVDHNVSELRSSKISPIPLVDFINHKDCEV